MGPRLVIIFLVLAGCVATPPAAPSTPTPFVREMPLALDACVIIESQVMIAEDVARRHVPEAFRPVADASGVRAILGGATCALGSRAFLAIEVEPVEEGLRAEHVASYFWEPEHDLVPGETIQQAFLQVGALATNATSIRANAEPAGARLEVDADAWAHRIELRAIFGPPARPLGATFREYAAAQGGYAYLEAGFALGEGGAFAAGPATITAGAGTTARDALGAQTAGLGIALTNAAYADAKLGFVPSAPAG